MTVIENLIKEIDDMQVMHVMPYMKRHIRIRNVIHVHFIHPCMDADSIIF